MPSHYHTASVLLMTLFVGCSQPQTQVSPSARHIVEVAKAVSNAKAKELAEHSAEGKSAVYRRLASEISAIDGRKSAEDVVQHGIDVSAWAMDMSVFWQRVGLFAQQVGQIKQHYSSDTASIEFVLRALNGDPYGKFNEAAGDNRKINSELHELQKDELELNSRLNQLIIDAKRLGVKYQ